MRKLIILALAGSLGSAAFGQNLVQNPGFETDDFTDWNVQDASSGSLVLVNGPSSSSFYNVHSGDWAVQFGATAELDDFVYQTIATVAGASYTYSLWVHGGGSPENLDVYWDTSSFTTGGGNEFSSTVLNDGAWTELTFNVVASTNSTTIGFGGYDGPVYTSVDDVSVIQATPEPASMAILGLGVVGLIRRRRNRS